ncbi:MAG TPA: diguanylate cyclase [Cyanobacteria bacterium UBA8803]|nr:diguanylate cyclase [Cyanobacteria bacterium UBA9273]HBL60550.1 diguanylate cyclase [Cyanobacteria bacterium UBA8803]
MAISFEHLHIDKTAQQSAIDCYLLTIQAAMINQIAQVTQGVLLLKDVLHAAVRQLREALQVSDCLIFQALEHQLIAAGLDSAVMEQATSILSDICTKNNTWLAQGQTVSLPGSEQQLPPALENWARACGFGSILLVPLLYRQSFYGAIGLIDTGKERQWMPQEIAFVQAIATHWAIAFYQGELEQRYQAEIQERQQAIAALQVSEARNCALLEIIPDAIFRVRRDGIYLDWKAAKADTLPINTSEIIGKHLHQVLPTEVAGLIWEHVELALETKDIQIVEYQQWLNGKARYFEARIVTSGSEEVSAIVQDITEHVQARLILEQVNDALKVRVEERTAALKKMNQALKAEIIERRKVEKQLRASEAQILNALAKEKELSDLKSHFITITSHQFRTPLTTIQSSAELLEYYGHKWSQEKKLTHLHRVQTSVKNMTKLLNDVLIIGNAEVGKLEFAPQPLDLENFCQTLVEEIQLNYTHQHQLVFTTETTEAQELNYFQPPCMDRHLLRQILENLLNNSIKYSPRGSSVELILSYYGEQAIFKVCDRGMGIPTEDRERLFETFYRATNVGTIAGTGLGLAIVKKCVELHQGQISLESQIGVGTTFTVTLPLSNSLFTHENAEKDSSY